MVDSSMMPQLGYLVDIRHTAVYGSVYAIGDVAFCLGFAIGYILPTCNIIYIANIYNNFSPPLGPALSGTLVQNMGFEWMLFGIAIISFIYAPFLYFLRNPPTKEEREVSLLCHSSYPIYATSRDHHALRRMILHKFNSLLANTI